jgi:PAS domain S-box-containing protein
MGKRKNSNSQISKLTNRIVELENELSNIKKQKLKIDSKSEGLTEFKLFSNIGYLERSLSSKKISYSKETLNVLGLNPNKKIFTDKQFFAIVHPDDVNKLKSIYAKSKKSKTNFEALFRIKLKNGNSKYICEKGINEFDSTGKLVRSIGIIQDVTNRREELIIFKESEEKFRTFFEFNKAVMLQINFENKKIINCNNAAVEFYGYTKEELLTKSIYDINTMSRKEIDKLMRDAVVNKIQHFRFQHKLANKEIKDVEVFASLIKLEHKVNLFVIVIDVTNEVKAEKEIVEYVQELKKAHKRIEEKRKKMECLNKVLKRSKQELLELNENKNKFFSIIAHDLRSPFMALSGISQMISEDMDSMSVKEVKNMASMIYNSTQNLYKLMENLLHWANLQMDTLKISPINFDIKQISQQVETTFQLSAKEKNVQIANKIRKTSTYADTECVKAILRNLLNNAIKFSKKNGVIHLSSKVEKNMIRIIVKDNGVGMSKETLSKLFSIKNKISKKGTANEIGTGLGLILCKELVEKNNGEIFVSSKLGKGSEFSFTLPKYKKN